LTKTETATMLKTILLAAISAALGNCQTVS